MRLQKFITHCLIIGGMLFGMVNAQGLSLDHYKNSCPGVEDIVKRITEQYVTRVPNFAPALLRMIFHDCAVRGCDASLLLNPTTSNNETEKTAIPNITLRGFEVIEAIKTALERHCPGVVSCADILALSSRDAIATIHGPIWDVPLGRKDGRISLASEALAFIPSPFSDIDSLKKTFATLGLTTKDLAVLSGSHSIGVGHCFIILSRLYNFNGINGATDPTLEPRYAEWLKTRCLNNPSDLKSFVFMDRITPKVFDKKYYIMITQNKGLFQSDVALLNDTETKNYIDFQVNTKGSTFTEDFANSMGKLIKVGVLTRNDQGEIRRRCGFINP